MLHHPVQPVRPAAIAPLRAWHTTALRVLLVLALSIVAAGCSATTGTDRAQTQSADSVHRAWVAAIRAGDHADTRDLVDPKHPDRAAFADDAVARMQDYLTNPASPTGALAEVMIEPVADGVGRSVWQFAQKRWCYRTELIHRGGRWYVSRWGQTSVDCP